MYCRYDYTPIFMDEVPPDRTECPVCWREYEHEWAKNGSPEDKSAKDTSANEESPEDKSAQDESQLPCYPLQTPCGHFIGSECVYNMTLTRKKMQCQTCFTDIPKQKSLSERLYAILLWPPFSYNTSWVQRFQLFDYVDELFEFECVYPREILLFVAFHLAASAATSLQVFIYSTIQYTLDIKNWNINGGTEQMWYNSDWYDSEYRSLWMAELESRRASILVFNAVLVICICIAQEITWRFTDSRLGDWALRFMGWLAPLPFIRFLHALGHGYMGVDLLLSGLLGMEAANWILLGALAYARI